MNINLGGSELVLEAAPLCLRISFILHHVLLDVLALCVGFGLRAFLGLVGALVSDVRGFVAAIFLAILCLDGCALAELVARVLDDTVSSARDLNFGNLNSASEALI